MIAIVSDPATGLALLGLALFVLLASSLLAAVTRHDAAMQARCARYDRIAREG